MLSPALLFGNYVIRVTGIRTPNKMSNHVILRSPSAPLRIDSATKNLEQWGWPPPQILRFAQHDIWLGVLS
jgi:hypothetical protein